MTARFTAGAPPLHLVCCFCGFWSPPFTEGTDLDRLMAHWGWSVELNRRQAKNLVCSTCHKYGPQRPRKEVLITHLEMEPAP